MPANEYRAGLAEVVKYGVILDAEFFAYLEANAAALIATPRPTCWSTVIARCCRLKADVVEKDEREETGLRAVLNYGHTFAHAFEALSGYGKLLHGEAVAIGMVCAARLAERLGRVDAPFTARQRDAAARRSACRSTCPKLDPEQIARRDDARQEGRTRPTALRVAEPHGPRGTGRRSRRYGCPCRNERQLSARRG